MAEKRTRPSGSAPEMPPSRNMGVGNASCGGRHSDADPLSSIVSAGARKEKLRQREFAPAAARRKVAPYVELRCASAFSFLDGASLPEDLVEEAARQEIPAVALIDRNGVYGAPRFYKAAKEAGLKAIVGAEVTLRQQGHPEGRRPEGSLSKPHRSSKGIPRSARDDNDALPRLTLLVASRDGYRN